MAAPAVGELLQEGLRLHRAGALKEATDLYSQALVVDSGNLDAKYYLCLIVSQQGRTEEAFEPCKRTPCRRFPAASGA